MEAIATVFLGSDVAMERRITQWLADSCDLVVWTNYGRQPLVPGLCRPWEQHPSFKRAVKAFEPQFIDGYIDDLEFGNHKSGGSYRHYRFMLTGRVRSALLRNGPAYNTFVGLWDPCYYQGDTLVASTVSHANLITLWVPFPTGDHRFCSS